jgi:hypothetical protein
VNKNHHKNPSPEQEKKKQSLFYQEKKHCEGKNKEVAEDYNACPYPSQEPDMHFTYL